MRLALVFVATALCVPIPVGRSDDLPRTVPSHFAEASWYGFSFHGRPTASGEPYNMFSLTAAHRVLPFGTRLRVTNLVNGRSVVVRVNDRGPFAGNRELDLSLRAAAEIGMVRPGYVRVRYERLLDWEASAPDRGFAGAALSD